MFLPAKKAFKLDKNYIQQVVKQALKEDLGKGDITTNTFIPAQKKIKGSILAKAAGVLSGAEVAAAVFRTLDPKVKIIFYKQDGQLIKKGQKLLSLQGSARAILSGERVALNFLQHLSGIATTTAQFVRSVKGTKTKILDTRKTIPGLRLLEKYAVKQGGGENHRLDLAELVLIKENHLALCSETLEEKIKSIKKKNRIKIEIETNTLAKAKDMARLKIDILMLDNMSLATMKRAVKIVRKINPKILIEASGNVDLKSVHKYARTGVDLISIGELTHSAKALDLSLLLDT
ncbi:carboxylating nicotinate-nucleotide diphosphorylase [Candidatus Margulisiibacteriota bacterium]